MKEYSDIRCEQKSNGQPMIYRTMRLINCMSSGIRYTREELCGKIDISRSSFFNYIATLRKVGFCIECREGRYRMLHIDDSLKEFSQLVHFSEEEAYLVNKAIDSISPSNMMKASLKNKLMSVYNVASLQEYTICRNYAERIDCLTKAIHNREAVMILSYCSSNSDSIRDRTVEPFAFTGNCRNLIAYDLESGSVKCFSPARMGDVLRLPQKWTHEDEHKVPETDIFDMMGDGRHHVKVRMDARARNLLEEEWPRAVKHIRKEGGCSWTLETEVCSMEGIGRFLLGLPDHTEIIEGPDLKEYMREKLEKALKKLQK